MADLLASGQITPVLGAGASLSERGDLPWSGDSPACLPSGGELGRYLASRAQFPTDEPASDLAKVAQYFNVVVGRSRLRQRLHAIFAGDFAPASIHHLLARIAAPLLIVTTNYDDLIERAFAAAGRAYDLVVYPTDNVEEWGAAVAHWRHGAAAPDYVSPKKLRIDLAQTTVIFKMHGTIDRQDLRREAYVITEDDYADFLVRMAKQAAIPAIFAEQFGRNHFLFLGYSLGDWNFRVILSKIERDLPRSGRDDLPSWSIQQNPSLLEQELWERRGVTIYDLPIKEFVDRLNRALGFDRAGASERAAG
jgi:hypothetical protein